MLTFLLILGGLIAFNFILLKFSMQSVDGKQKVKNEKSGAKAVIATSTKQTKIAEAA